MRTTPAPQPVYPLTVPKAHQDPALRIDLAGVALRTPIILAAGTAGTLDEMRSATDLAGVGAITTKSITPEERTGNAPWRVAPVKAGMINAIGLANPGIERFVAEYAPRIPQVGVPVIGSVAAGSIDGYAKVAEQLDALSTLAAIELNVSCPNTGDGTEFGADPALLAALVAAVRAAAPRTRVFVKLPPVTIGTPHGITDLARAATDPATFDAPSIPAGPNARPGADALCIANTTPATAIDVERGTYRLGNKSGGLSGPAVHQIAVKLVHDVHRTLGTEAPPIVGIGGVLAWDDAAELMLAGASAVQIGTGLFVSPRSPKRVAAGLARYARKRGHASVDALTGRVTEEEHQEE